MQCLPLSRTLSQNIPGSESRAGNHIVLSLGADQFALYAHLQPASIRVKVGDCVKRGQT
jgi:hypothetical protein